MRFIGKKKSFRLGKHTLFLPSEKERALVVCISEPRQRSDPEGFNMAQGLRLDRFNPNETESLPHLI